MPSTVPGRDSSPGPGILLDCDVHAGDWAWLGAPDALAAPVCAAVFAALDLGDEAVAADLALSDDAAVRVLNREWRGQDKPTNVLSFPAPEAAGREPSRLGDIVMAEETLLAEAESAGIPPRHHFQHLLVHALLHLLGYDHEEDSEAAEMEALETEILAGLGVPDPYADTEPASTTS